MPSNNGAARGDLPRGAKRWHVGHLRSLESPKSREAWAGYATFRCPWAPRSIVSSGTRRWVGPASPTSTKSPVGPTHPLRTRCLLLGPRWQWINKKISYFWMSWNDSIRQIKETAAVRCGGVRCGGHRSEIDNY